MHQITKTNIFNFTRIFNKLLTEKKHENVENILILSGDFNIAHEIIDKKGGQVALRKTYVMKSMVFK